jgi:hypothetical protein
MQRDVPPGLLTCDGAAEEAHQALGLQAGDPTQRRSSTTTGIGRSVFS